LKQLFIGSEGTIGIITAISILCPRRSSSTNVAVFSLPSYKHVLKVFGETKSHLGEILSAFEFFDAASYKLVKDHHKENGDEVKKVFDQEGEFYVLVETSGSNADHDEEVSAFWARWPIQSDRQVAEGAENESDGRNSAA